MSAWDGVRTLSQGVRVPLCPAMPFLGVTPSLCCPPPYPRAGKGGEAAAGRGERGGSGCFKAESQLGPGAGTAQLLKLEQQEWGRKKSRKVGLSCRRAQRPHPANSRLCACPGRFCFRGAVPKGSCPRPGLARVCGCHRGTPSPLLPPPRVPFPGDREGGRGRQPGQGGRGNGETQLAMPCAVEGTPGEGWGAGQKPAGMGTPAGLAALSPRHGCGGSRGSGALCHGGWQAARIRVRVCSLCPGEDGSDFRGAAGRPHRSPAWLQPR